MSSRRSSDDIVQRPRRDRAQRSLENLFEPASWRPPEGTAPDATATEPSIRPRTESDNARPSREAAGAVSAGGTMTTGAPERAGDSRLASQADADRPAVRASRLNDESAHSEHRRKAATRR